MSSEKIQSSIANPSPLGLLGFGMTTVLLNLHNADIIPLSVVILSMGFALGGVAQVIAGIMEFMKNNVFGATAFTAYGFFWLSLIVIWTNPGEKIAVADERSMGFYLLLWGVFSAFMFICTLKHNRAIQFVFLTLTMLFLMLSIGDFTGSAAVKNAAGWVGILCGASAIYNSVAQIINHEYGKVILPL